MPDVAGTCRRWCFVISQLRNWILKVQLGLWHFDRKGISIKVHQLPCSWHLDWDQAMQWVAFSPTWKSCNQASFGSHIPEHFMMASLRHGSHIDPPMSRSMWDWIHSDDLRRYFGIMEVTKRQIHATLSLSKKYVQFKVHKKFSGIIYKNLGQ